MPARIRRKALNPEIYTQLIRDALPIPPVTEADNNRLIEVMAGIDERTRHRRKRLSPNCWLSWSKILRTGTTVFPPFRPMRRCRRSWKIGAFSIRTSPKSWGKRD